jgi:hypothetical protein
MTTAAPRTSGGIGKPSTAVTLALNGVPGKILEEKYPIGGLVRRCRE